MRISRRTALAGSAGLAAATLLRTTAQASIEPDPFIKLGKELERADAAYRAANDAFDAAWDEALRHHPELSMRTAEAWDRDCRPARAAYNLDALGERVDAAHAVVDEIETAIVETPARSVLGLALKLRVITWWIAVEEFDDPYDAPTGEQQRADNESGLHYYARLATADAQRLAGGERQA